jgi:hypothetical protein
MMRRRRAFSVPAFEGAIGKLMKQNDKQIERATSQGCRFYWDTSAFGAGDQQSKWSTTMVRIAAIAVAAALFSLPAAAQNKGKSGTAPGQAQTTPGRQQTAPGGARDLAPGQIQTEPGGAKDLAPGAGQRKTK